MVGRTLRGCECGPPPYECLLDDQIITQLNDQDGSFRPQPRLPKESDMSVLLGEVDVETAFRNVVGRDPFEGELDGRLVRSAKVGDIRRVGFAVVHTPSRRVKNSLHSSIVWPADAASPPEVPWIEEMINALDLCFSDADEKVKP